MLQTANRKLSSWGGPTTPASPVQFTGAANANNAAGLFVAGAGAIAALLI
jgi:hypothetical protein